VKRREPDFRKLLIMSLISAIRRFRTVSAPTPNPDNRVNTSNIPLKNLTLDISHPQNSENTATRFKPTHATAALPYTPTPQPFPPQPFTNSSCLRERDPA
jgi:hypothetical protein